MTYTLRLSIRSRASSMASPKREVSCKLTSKKVTLFTSNMPPDLNFAIRNVDDLDESVDEGLPICEGEAVPQFSVVGNRLWVISAILAGEGLALCL